MKRVDYPFSVNPIQYHTFLGFISTKVLNAHKLDLELLSKEFQIDLTLQNNTLTQNNVIVDKSTEIGSTRNKLKLLSEEPNSANYEVNGFLKVTYPLSPEYMYYSNPPEFIPIGCYCTVCLAIGPYPHSHICNKPKKNSLSFTLDGLSSTIYHKRAIIYKNYQFSALNNFFTSFKQSVPNKKIFKDKNKIKELLQTTITTLPSEENGIKLVGGYEEEGRTNIAFSDIMILTKRDNTKFFAGPMMIKYKNGTKNVTVRVRPNGCIELISNPWYDKYLYKKIIDRINNTSQKIKYIKGEMRTFFSSVTLFSNPRRTDTLNGIQYLLDVEQIYDYLWPRDNDNIPIVRYPKEEINKTAFLRTHDNKLHQYEIFADKDSRNRIYIDFTYFDEKIGPFKISTQLFSQGQLQMTFGYTKRTNIQNISIDSQFEIISKMYDEIHKLILYHICNSSDPTQFYITQNKEFQAKKIYETIDGCIPYSKRKKYLPNDKVHLFNYQSLTWPTKIWEVVRQIDNNYYNHLNNIVQNDNKYDKIDKYYEIIDDWGEKKTVHLNDIRKMISNNDQVCRLKENGIYRQPIPYSYYGNTPGGYNQLIKPMGIIARSNNKFYPYCIDVKQEDEEWLISFILNGYTPLERRLFLVNPTDVDNFCGTFKPGTCQIGTNVVLEDGRVVQIYDKYKIHGKGNDNIEVIYKVFSEKDGEFEITGKDFSKNYIENRDFKGLLSLNPDKLKEVMREALIALDLIRSTINIPTAINLSNPKQIINNCKLLTKLNFKEMIDDPMYEVSVIPYEYHNIVKGVVNANGEGVFLYIDRKGWKLSDDKFKEEIIMRGTLIQNYGIVEKFYHIDKFEAKSLSYYKKYEQIINILKNHNIQYINDVINIKLFLKQKIHFKYDNNTILFASSEDIYIASNLNRPTIVLQTIEKCPQPNGSWKLGLVGNDGKVEKIKNLSNFEVEVEGAKLYDFVKIKPNLMFNYEFNPISPIIDIARVEKEDYVGYEKTKEHLEFLLHRIDANNISHLTINE